MEGEIFETHISMEDNATVAPTTYMDTGPGDDEDEKLIEKLDTFGSIDTCEGDTTFEPYEGMEFDSEEAAKSFYGKYAAHVGFRVRISRYTRSRRDNSIISRRIVCSKEGFRDGPRTIQGLITGERRQRQRAVTRVGCKAMIMVKKTGGGRWVVTKFVKEHNHDPVPPRKVEVRVVQKDDNPVGESLAPGVEVVCEPHEGMEFDSEEDAKSYYNAYARHAGFRARVSRYCRSRRDDTIISRQIVCSKEGFREIRASEVNNDEKVKRSRVSTRIGCKAMIVVKKSNSGKWVVSKFEREHNHLLVASKDSILLPSHANIKKGSVINSQGERVIPNVLVMGGVQDTSQEAQTVLYNHLCHEAMRYAQEGAATIESYNVAISALREAVEKVAAAKEAADAIPQLGFRLSAKDVLESNEYMVPLKSVHELQQSSEVEQAVTTKEHKLMQRPISFALMHSTSPNDASHENRSFDGQLMLNVTNEQLMSTPTDCQRIDATIPVSSLEQPLLAGRKRGHQKTDGDQHHNAVEKSQKLENFELTQTSSTSRSSDNLKTPILTDAQILTDTTTFPFTPKLHGTENPRESCSGGAYAIVAAPVEAQPASPRLTKAGTQSQPSVASCSGHPTTPAPSDEIEPYKGGPNPQVHATAIAVGARIVPPSEAASVMKAIEARIRLARTTHGGYRRS